MGGEERVKKLSSSSLFLASLFLPFSLPSISYSTDRRGSPQFSTSSSGEESMVDLKGKVGGRSASSLEFRLKG